MLAFWYHGFGLQFALGMTFVRLNKSLRILKLNQLPIKIYLDLFDVVNCYISFDYFDLYDRELKKDPTH